MGWRTAEDGVGGGAVITMTGMPELTALNKIVSQGTNPGAFDYKVRDLPLSRDTSDQGRQNEVYYRDSESFEGLSAVGEMHIHGVRLFSK